MPNRNVTKVPSMKLPDALKNLILQKLRHTRIELDSRVLGLNQVAHSKLRKEMLDSINIRPVEHFFSVIPLGIYNEIVANATAITREWPEIVWQTITSILDKAIDVSCDSNELNALVDEFAWDSNQHPFTLTFVDSDRFRALVAREASGYGLVQEETEFSDRQWDIASKLSQTGIINSARYSREGISIAIEEYLLQKAGNTSPSTLSSTPSTTRRVARKLNTQDMYESWRREYRNLKKIKPGKSDNWYSTQITKMPCAQGRSAETIRRNLKGK